jgi:beta-xylosidase
LKNYNKVSRSEYNLQHGPHNIEFLTSNEFKERYKINHKVFPKYKCYQNIGLIHLYCESFKKLEKYINKSNFNLIKNGDKMIISHKTSDGFIFCCEEKDIQEYLNEIKSFTKVELI